jgi:uncharacterized ParB-like nuclease family protein
MISASDGCDLGENLATQAMTNLAERGSLGENRILKDQLKGRLMLSDGGQIFVPGQQLLVHRSCDVGQDACPTHNGLFAPIPCGGDRPKKVPERLRHRYAGRGQSTAETALAGLVLAALAVRITAEQVRPMLKRESFPIAKIYVPVKRRATLRPEAVREIAESMLEIGQETPILVRRDGDRFVLVEGLHRLEACKALGEETIVGFLVSAKSNHEKAPSPYDVEADAVREKTQRLKKLRLAQTEEKRHATSDVVPMEAAKRSTEKPSRSGHIATRAKPATLADWLVARERDGFRD